MGDNEFLELIEHLDFDHFKNIAKKLDKNEDEIYIRSYSCLLEFTEYVTGESHLDMKTSIPALAHMVYGWMPTMLDQVDYKKVDSEISKDLINRVKSDNNLSDKDISCIKAVTNNSIVGASKLLHFLNPKKYPIFDSRVVVGIARLAKMYTGIEEKDVEVLNIVSPTNLSQKIEWYKKYREKLQKIIDEKKDVFGELKKKLRNEHYLIDNASDMRTLEVCLFAAGIGIPKERKEENEKDKKANEKRAKIINQLRAIFKP